MPADLFVVKRRHPQQIVEQNIVHKEEEIALQEGGGLLRRPLPPERCDAPSLSLSEIATLATYGVRLEEVLPCSAGRGMGRRSGRQGLDRAIARAGAGGHVVLGQGQGEDQAGPHSSGGRTIYPGRVSGKVYLVNDPSALGATPEGAIVFLRKASPEIVEIFPRIAGPGGGMGQT